MKNELNPNKETIVFGNDSVVIRKYISGIPGGRTLDVSDYKDDAILAGHVIIKTKEGNYAPMPCHAAKAAEGETAAVEAGYDALPEGASYVGILYRSISRKNPEAAIMYDGIVNPECVPYPLAGILEAFKAACPHIIFEQDEEA